MGDDALSYFKEQRGSDGVSLFDHVTKLLAKLISERPENAFARFEELSTDLRAPPPLASTASTAPTHAPPFADCAPLLEPVPVEEDEEPVDEETLSVEVQDVVALFGRLRRLGVFVDASEAALLARAMRRLAAAQGGSGMSALRCFGRVGPYYVLEAEYEPGTGEMPESEAEEESEEESEAQEPEPEAEEGGSEQERLDPDDPAAEAYCPPGPEPRVRLAPEVPADEYQTGANLFVYYCALSLGSLFVRLPDLTPAAVAEARARRTPLAGDAATELPVLRGLVALIRHETSAAPAGELTVLDDPEDPESLLSWPRADPDFAGRSGPVRWVHAAPPLLSDGKCFDAPVYLQAEEEEEEEIEEPDEDEDPAAAVGRSFALWHAPLPPRPVPLLPPEKRAEYARQLLLRDVMDDERLVGKAPWTTREAGGCSLLLSHRWPGASSVAWASGFASVYWGDGLARQPLPTLPHLCCVGVHPCPTEQYEPTPAMEATAAEFHRREEQGLI